MPTYEYECTTCGHRFEKFQSMVDKPLTKCPKCKKKVKRLIGTGAGIIFKGSGFYATDYKKGSASKTPPCQGNKQNEGCKSCPAAKNKDE